MIGDLGCADATELALLGPSGCGKTIFLAAKRQGDAMVLAGGYKVDAATMGAELPASTQPVSLTVRPEQVRLAGLNEPGAIPATLTSLVYFGTDTDCPLTLTDGSEVVARLQSPATGAAGYDPGQKWRCGLLPVRFRCWRIRAYRL